MDDATDLSRSRRRRRPSKSASPPPDAANENPEYDLSEPTMAEKLAALTTDGAEEEEERSATAVAVPPSADSVHMLLKQALRADDRATLLGCLYNRDDKFCSLDAAYCPASAAQKEDRGPPLALLPSLPLSPLQPPWRKNHRPSFPPPPVRKALCRTLTRAYGSSGGGPSPTVGAGGALAAAAETSEVGGEAGGVDDEGGHAKVIVGGCVAGGPHQGAHFRWLRVDLDDTIVFSFGCVNLAPMQRGHLDVAGSTSTAPDVSPKAAQKVA